VKRIFRRPSPAMVVAIVALIAALGGTAVAGGVLNKKKVNRIISNRAPGLSVANAVKAAKADDADKVSGLAASALQTGAASDVRTDTNALPSDPSETVLRATITTPAAKVLTAVASVEAVGDGGGNDNINCNLNIDGVDGARQSTYITPNAQEDSTTLPLTQARSVGAGAHTVIVECTDGGLANTSVEDRSLSVVSTG
jgi:hypothetical protein